MRTLSDTQKNFLRIYDNLQYDTAHYVASVNEPQNFAERLLDDFMQDNIFADAIRSIAVDFGRQDILHHVDNYTPLPQGRFGAAEGLVAAVERGDDAMLADLIKQPLEPSYSLDELNTFWNIAANLQDDNPEVYTHLVADSRYISIFDQTVAANEYNPDTIAPVRAQLAEAHEAANNTLDTIEYDMFQMEYAGMSSDLYELLGRGDFERIGDELTQDAPQTIFSGLQVAQPMAESELLQVTVSHDDYYGAIQAVKDFAAEEAANALLLADEFNISAAEIEPEIAVADIELEQEPEPEPELEQEPEIIENTAYVVQPGDSLWKIAQNEYGLDSYKDIMRAVEHIAHENGLSEGVQANHIDVGQELSMPTLETISGPPPQPPGLDWHALDADVAQRSQMAFAP